MPQIKVKCQAAIELALDVIEDFQGNLKELSINDATKLKQSVITDGIISPNFVWASDGRYFDIDGHQRVKIYKELQREGWALPKIPCVLIMADTIKEAKARILKISSTYGQVTSDGLKEFMQMSALVASDIEDSIKLPDFDMNQFLKDYYDGVDNVAEELKESTDIPDMELRPSEHHDYLVLLFDDANDFMYACDKFGVKKVNAHTTPGKKHIGIGRCINGRMFLSKIATIEENAAYLIEQGNKAEIQPKQKSTKKVK